MESRDNKPSEEGGQVLVLFALMFFALAMFLALTIDTGMLIIERRGSQNVVDAAALAGAQELPDDSAQAEVIARDYVGRHGMDPNEFSYAFYCTSTLIQICDPANNKYDTLRVQTTQTAPAFFGPLVALFDSNNCWAKGCSTTVQAAACRGACGSAGGDVDVILALDHTGSMTVTDLANAKSGAQTFMEAFDHQTQRLALAVTPPVDPTNHCDTINAWTDPKVWLPVQLNSLYQSASHILAPTSQLVATANCLDLPQSNVELPGPHTNLGEPLKAALTELQTGGRPDAKWGIVLLSDGAANIVDAAAATPLGATGPCDYAVKVAQQIRTLGIEIYTIAYGADDRCTRDQVGSYWYNRSANQLLAAIATDADHTYVEPKTGDLDEVFQAIGSQLAGGSKLVE